MGKTKNHEGVHADSLRVQRKMERMMKDGGRFSQLAHQSSSAALAKSKQRPPLAPQIIAGAVHGTVVLMSFTSFAFLIFGNSEHEELQAAFPLGISQQVLSAGVLIGILTYSGFFPFTMGGPTPPAALLVADVVRVTADAIEDSEKMVPTCLLVVSLISLIMGALLILFGLTKTAHYAQQLPYPVLCGFLGSVGLLLIRNSFQILLSIKLKWIFVPKDFDDVANLEPSLVAAHLVLGISVAALLLFGIPRIAAWVVKCGVKSTAVLPICFVLPLICFFMVTGLSGMNFGTSGDLWTNQPSGDLRTNQPSWLFPDVKTKPFWNLWIEVYNPGNWDLAAIASSIPNMLIASVLCVIAALINMAGIEANAPQENSLNLDVEFVQLGRACLATGALGGHPGHHVAAFTMPMKKDGGTTRVAPWTASAMWLIVFLSGVPINSYVPRFFMGGCFLQIGFGLSRLFLWDNRKSTDLASKAIAWMMVLVALFLDLNYAAGFGFVLVSLNYIRLSTDVDVVGGVTRLDMRRSPKLRPIEELKTLSTFGHKVMMMHLQGYLFWGTVDKISVAFAEVIDGSEDDPDVIYVDLEHVSGIEVSVIGTFRKLHRIAKNVGIRIVVCGIPDAHVLGHQIDTLLRSLPFASNKTLDELLEESEDDLTKRFAPEIPRLITVNPKTPMEIEIQERRTTAKQRTMARYAHAGDCVYGIRWELIDNVFYMSQSFNSEERARTLVAIALMNQKPVQSFVTESMNHEVMCDLATKTSETTVSQPPSGNTNSTKPSLTNRTHGGGPRPRTPAAALPKTHGDTMPVDSTASFESEPKKDEDSIDANISAGTAENVLCQAWIHQQCLLCRDVLLLSDAAFPRKALAQEWGIRRIMFIPTADGVYEMGSPEIVKAHETLPLVSELSSSFLEEVLTLFPFQEGAGRKQSLYLSSTQQSDNTQKIGNEAEKFSTTISSDKQEEGEEAKADNLLPVPCHSPVKIGGQLVNGDLAQCIDGLRTHFTWKLLLAMETLGSHLQVTKGTSLVSGESIVQIPGDMFIVTDGVFGTYNSNHVASDGDAAQLQNLVLKSGMGSLLGGTDVFLKRPWSVEIVCLSDDGRVVKLDSEAVRKLETCDSPFVDPESSHEFIEYVKHEMALQNVTLRSTGK